MKKRKETAKLKRERAAIKSRSLNLQKSVKI